MSIKGIWFVLIMYTKRLIREILKAIWRFLSKKRYAGNMPKLKKAIMLTFLSINAIAWIVAPSYLLVSIPNEKIIIEAKAQGVGTMVKTEETETAVQDTTNGAGERKDEPEISESSAPQAVGKKATVTAYNSVPEQTDGNPCLSADGTNICEFDGCVIAQNGVPFGTKVEIEGFGVCEVHDRKNSRYDSNWIDIYFGGADKVDEALVFGKKELSYKFLNS